MQAHPSAAAFPDGESMADMSARAVAAVRQWDARVEAEHGADAVWVAVSHGDVIKAILADALGIHLDAFQRIVVDPRIAVGRPLHARCGRSWSTMNSAAGDLSHLRPPPKRSVAAARRAATRSSAAGGGSARRAAWIGHLGSATWHR